MSELLGPEPPSSIEAVWPPTDSTHQRLRGFYNEAVLDSETAVRDFAGQFHHYRQTIAADAAHTRLSVRAVTTPEALRDLQVHQVPVEAVLPLALPEQSLVIAYTGWNAPGRAIRPADVTRHQQTLANAIGRTQTSEHSVASLAGQGITPACIEQTTSEADRRALVPKFAGLYAIFGYNLEQTEALLLDPNNVIAYLRHGNEVVSTAMAESGELAIKGLEPLRIAEITEASTLPAYRGLGLYRLVSGLLAQRLRSPQTRPLHAIYGESNLAMPGVIIAAHHNGRRFSHFDAERYGIHSPQFGILPQNFRVEDGTETRPYNDFALSYLPITLQEQP
ncbi:MAG TPA: hypothetical protein VLF40_03170 [Candidatus Saccharimonadales bacterium]|nr:hypothetical protein [Candidatus Saccharimonadales bacterium]